MKKFFENNWFPIMMGLLGIAAAAGILGAMEDRAALSKACIESGAVLVSYDSTAYCAAPSQLVRVEIK